MSGGHAGSGYSLDIYRGTSVSRERVNGWDIDGGRGCRHLYNQVLTETALPAAVPRQDRSSRTLKVVRHERFDWL